MNTHMRKHSQDAGFSDKKKSAWLKELRALAFVLALALSGTSGALSMVPTPSLEKRIADGRLIFVGKLVNRVQRGDWVQAELLVEEPLKNVKKGDTVPVIWRLLLVGGRSVAAPVEGNPGIAKVQTVGAEPMFDRAAGARGIAILGDKHKGRYWLRADKYEDVSKLGEVKKLVGGGAKGATAPIGKSLVEGNSDFALKLYQQLKEREGNLFFSPYSISSTLGMTYVGARGQTASQMKEALSFQKTVEELCRSFGHLRDSLNAIQNDDDIKLSIANAIWAEKSYTFLPEFIELTREKFKSKLAQADFIKNFEAERLTINDWVEKETNNRIKNLIGEGVLSSLTRLVLVNAIHFKGDWASQFDKQHTRERDFHVSSDKKVSALTMFQQDEFPLSADADTQMLELPYKGDRLSMLVLLPKQKNGIEQLENSLTLEKLDRLTGGLRKTKVAVSLPKFKVTSEYDLVAPFKALGMTDAFGKQADFSGMDGTRDLYISAILHKAFVQVDEKGTEAAAATAVLITRTSARVTPRFTADHPFLFLIRDNATGAILFMGRVTDPTA